MNENYPIAGVDEVGRGPLAGPVIAAAVILRQDLIPDGITDSKKVNEKKRVILAKQIKQYAMAWSIGRADKDEIDEINILNASLLAMKRAIESLPIKPAHVQVDGNKVPEVSCSIEAIIKGDSKIPAISAASIIAKVERDTEMIAMDKIYPGYGFANHKGYPTDKHIKAIEELGITPIHRLSFSPVRRCL